jgi:hypothetical protein
MGIGGDILGYCCSISPINLKVILGYPNIILLGKLYWGTAVDALARGWQTGLTERLRWQPAGLFGKVTPSVEVLSSWFLLFFPLS